MSEDSVSKILDAAAPAKIRLRLESVFDSIHTVEAVVVVCYETLRTHMADIDPEGATVLMRAASDPLHLVLKELTQIIESLGGTTIYREIFEKADDDDAKGSAD